jgi:hypothetical protein
MKSQAGIRLRDAIDSNGKRMSGKVPTATLDLSIFLGGVELEGMDLRA